MKKSVSVVRKTLALLIGLIVLAIFFILFYLTDLIFRVYDRLQHSSGAFLIFYAVMILIVAGSGAVLVWRVWTVGKQQKNHPQTQKKQLTVEELQQRTAAARAQGVDVSVIEADLAALEIEPQELDVAFFGKISTGKSSLIQTLLPNAAVETSIIGGSTTMIERYHYENPFGLTLKLLDMPGTEQAGTLHDLDNEVITAARRVHIVVYVIDQDITATDMDTIEALHGFGKPMIVALNKINHYSADELKTLKAHIRTRLPEDICLVMVASAYPQTLRRVDGQGNVIWEERMSKGDIRSLLNALAELSGERGTLALRNRQALIHLADENLNLHLSKYRYERGEAMVKGYARKAMLGGVAAVGPGTDVLIQGYLGMDMLKSLTKLYNIPVKEIDLQALVDAAGSKVKSHLTIILALAGNVCKAFPGIGTVLGGASHAVAYGLVFESLGRATLQALNQNNKDALNTQNIVKNFEEQLNYDLEKRAQSLVRIALSGRNQQE